MIKVVNIECFDIKKSYDLKIIEFNVINQDDENNQFNGKCECSLVNDTIKDDSLFSCGCICACFNCLNDISISNKLTLNKNILCLNLNKRIEN